MGNCSFPALAAIKRTAEGRNALSAAAVALLLQYAEEADMDPTVPSKLFVNVAIS